MKLGKKIQLPALTGLGLAALDYTLPDSSFTRTIKIYKVPAGLSADQYYISSTAAAAIEVVPGCRVRDTLLLAEYNLSPDGSSTILYLNEEVKNA